MSIDPKSFYFALDVHNSSYIFHLKQVFRGVWVKNIERIQPTKLEHSKVQYKQTELRNKLIKLKKRKVGRTEKKNDTITWRALSFDLWRYTKEATHEPRAKLKKERKKKKRLVSFFLQCNQMQLQVEVFNLEQRRKTWKEKKESKYVCMEVWKQESFHVKDSCQARTNGICKIQEYYWVVLESFGVNDVMLWPYGVVFLEISLHFIRP